MFTKRATKIFPNLICTISLYNVTLQTLPPGVREYFPTPWIWAVPVSCLDQQTMVEVLVVTSKSRPPQETCQQLFLPSWSIALKLPWGEDQTLGAWKTMWPNCPGWSPPDQPANSQSTTTRYVSEAISNHLAPVKLPVNWSQNESPPNEIRKQAIQLCPTQIAYLQHHVPINAYCVMPLSFGVVCSNR